MSVHSAAKKLPNYPGRKGLERAVGRVTAPLGKKYAGHAIQRLLGFWALWHTYGDLDGLIGAGLISRSGAYTQRREFRDMFGVDVADWQPSIGAELFSGGVAEQLSGADVAKHRRPQQTMITAGGNAE